MSKDVMAINKAGDEVASLRYLASDKNSMAMYFVLRPMDENGKIQMDNDVELLMSEDYVAGAMETFNSMDLDKFYGNNDDAKQTQKDKLRAFLDVCEEWAKKEGQVKLLIL